MEAWCTAHPWMTFFVILAVCSVPPRIVLAIRGREED